MATGSSLANQNMAEIHAQYDYMHGHINRFVLDGDASLQNAEGKMIAARILECKRVCAFTQSDWG